jgi:hypothetical protein
MRLQDMLVVVGRWRDPTGFAVVLLLAVACSPDTPRAEAAGPWVGAVTTEGNVTTVVNESGSVWGGTATLVEEASIGVAAGDEPYMFGSLISVWATDELIYVLDRQVRALRAFDHDGRWLRDVGRIGQGPGEFERPDAVLVGEDGRVFVFEGRNARINIYSPDGEALETWTMDPRFGSTLELGDGGDFFAMKRGLGNDGAFETADDTLELQHVEAGGALGPRIISPVVAGELRTPSAAPPPIYVGLPYGVSSTLAFAPFGAFLSGKRGEYSFEITGFDGQVIRVERYWTPVPVTPELREYHRQRIEAQVRERMPGWAWDGAEIPEHKRAFESIFGDRTGRILLFREGASHRVEGCEIDFTEPGSSFPQCWRTEYFWDVFDNEGIFLGRVESPVGWVGTPFIRDDLWLIRTEDEAGTVMVKRYRLVLPEREVDQ